MDPNRLNSPSTCTITLEVMGHELHFAQDPNSKHLGTTVWDASMVFAKYLEKNCRKGRFSASKLKGKRVIELGAGCGVAGFAMAILGCHVISTDQREVLPLLKRNVEWNTSRIVQTNHSSESFGSLQVAELDWGNEDHIMAVQPPFDYVIGTDVVYAEQLLEPLRRTIIALSGPKTTIMLGYEIRSTSVHEKMLQIWKDNFEVKTIPRSKMDGKYQDPSIHLYIMGQKSSSESSQDADLACSHEEVDTNETEKEKVESVGSYCLPNEGEEAVVLLKEDSILTRLREGKLSDWERRRYGTIAAQLLRDVKIDVKVNK